MIRIIIINLVCLLVFAASSFATEDGGSHAGAQAGAAANAGAFGNQLVIHGAEKQTFPQSWVPHQFWGPATFILPGRDKDPTWNAQVPLLWDMQYCWPTSIVPNRDSRISYEVWALGESEKESIAGTEVVNHKYPSPVHVKEIKEDYELKYLISVSTPHKDVSYNALFLESLRINQEQLGEPTAIVVNYGFNNRGRGAGWSVGSGAGGQFVEGGAGLKHGMIGGGTGTGATEAEAHSLTYLNIYVGAPKGFDERRNTR